MTGFYVHHRYALHTVHTYYRGGLETVYFLHSRKQADIVTVKGCTFRSNHSNKAVELEEDMTVLWELSVI